MMRARQWPFAPGRGDGRIGVGLLVLSLLIVVPVPFANWLPSLASFCIGVALTARDGWWLAAGLAIGIVSIAVFALLVSAAALAVSAIA